MSGLRPIPVAIALGSNVGDRHSHLAFAVRRLRSLLSDIRISSWHETEPVSVGAQPLFLNGVVTGLTSQPSPRALLTELLEIERERGRERPHVGAPRTLDLDLILYGTLWSTNQACRFRTRASAIACLCWSRWPSLRVIGVTRSR